MFYKTPKNSESGQKIAAFLQQRKAAHNQLREITEKVGAKSFFTFNGGAFACFVFEGEPCSKTFKFVRPYAGEWRGDQRIDFYKATPRGNTKEGKEVNKMLAAVPTFCVFNTDANKLFGWDGITRRSGPDKYLGWFIFNEAQEVYLITHHACAKGFRPVMPSDVIEITETEYDNTL